MSGFKKVSLAQQLEECQMALKDLYPYMSEKPGVKAYRTERMQAIGRSLAFLIKHEEGFRAYIDSLKRLDDAA